MKPLDHYTNGDDGCDSEGSEGEADGETEDLSLVDVGAPARALGALNALRKSRQHYDVVLVAGGAEVPAHRAVLAAASPYLLEALAPASPPGAPYPVQEVEGEALRALVEYAYTGRLVVRDALEARRLYRAAWRLRLEAARAHLAERLLRRLQPQDCLAVRALPGLTTEQLQVLDKYIADNFDELCSCGALATLPQIRIEVMRESAGSGGDEAPLTVADAALAWLREQPTTERDFTELCSRAHLVFVDGRGLLRDCGELPAAAGDAPELQQYRRESAARKRAPAAPPPAQRAGQLGARTDGTACAVLGARGCLGGGCRALLSVNGRLAGALAVWSGVARGAAAGPGAALQGGARIASLNGGRCALGAVAVDGLLLACGGYDRARVLRSAELYHPRSNTWAAAPGMRRERARFPAARLRDTVYVIGGSDGHAELDSVDAYSEGAWRGVARLPLALSHAAGAADPAAGVLYVAGGWAQGTYLRRAFKYSPEEDVWSEAPPLNTGRAQCAGVLWEGCMWVLGGCDAWHCLASTERLVVSEGAWAAGPALPSARRSVGGAVWRGRLVSVGGSDGAASLRRTDWLEPDCASHTPQAEVQQEGASLWQAGPLLRKARAGPGVAVLGEALYAVGGFDGKDFLACAECLLHPDGEWTALAMHAAPQGGLDNKGGSGEQGGLDNKGGKGGLNDIAEEIVKDDLVKDLKKKLSIDGGMDNSEDVSEKRTDNQTPATAAH